MDIMQEITSLLCSLGSTRATRGRQRTIAVIAMSIEDENRLTPTDKKQMYDAVGKQAGCKGSAVERNIRTVSERAWKEKRKHLIQIAGYDVEKQPSAAEFVDIATNYILRREGDV